MLPIKLLILTALLCLLPVVLPAPTDSTPKQYSLGARMPKDDPLGSKAVKLGNALSQEYKTFQKNAGRVLSFLKQRNVKPEQLLQSLPAHVLLTNQLRAEFEKENPDLASGNKTSHGNVLLETDNDFWFDALWYNTYVKGKTVDLRKWLGKNFITAVKDQGSCGSCTAFATAAAVEGTINRVLLRSSGNHQSTPDLSEASLFSCYDKNLPEQPSCVRGWHLHDAANWVNWVGMQLESSYPYSKMKNAATCSRLNNKYYDGRIEAIPISATTTIIQKLRRMMDHGPLATRFNIYEDFFSLKKAVYKYDGTSEFAGGHAVACIGWDDVNSAWICKNSWGTPFGDNGYFRMSIDANVGLFAGETYAFNYHPNSRIFNVVDKCWRGHQMKVGTVRFDSCDLDNLVGEACAHNDGKWAYKAIQGGSRFYKYKCGTIGYSYKNICPAWMENPTFESLGCKYKG